MKFSKLLVRCVFLSIVLLAPPSICFAQDYYLAPTGSDQGDGSITNPWHSLNFALNKHANDGVNSRIRPGDTLYLRGGVHDVTAMSDQSDGVVYICMNTNSGSPSITIKSYPGEWAILDGGKSEAVLTLKGAIHNVLFENMEVRNGLRAGFRFGDGYEDRLVYNSVIRNIYFHDNNDPDYNQNPAGMQISGDNCIVEYCTFENNGTPGSSHHNSANLILYNRYYGYPEPTPRKNNIVRYNNFIGSASQIKDKGDSNFVDNNNPTQTNSSWANEIHHNVFDGARGQAYYSAQDFVKFHHNLILNSSNGGVKLHKPESTTEKTMWWAQVYNNTFVNISNWAIQVEASDRSTANSSPGDNIHSNVIYNCSSDAILLWTTTSTNFTITADYNVWDDSVSTVGRKAKNSAASLSTWQGYGYGTHSLIGNVSFVNPGSNDYRLNTGSAGVAKGQNGSDAGAFGITNWYSSAGINGSLPAITVLQPPANLRITN